MKISGLLFVLALLMFPKISFADGNSYISNFNEYVNSPADSSASLVNKDIASNQAIGNEAVENSDKTDTQQVLPGIPSKWRVCTTDNDCIATVADCVSWDAFNKEYLKKLSKNLRSCSTSIDPGFQPQAACVAKMCETTDKTTDISWEEWLNENSIKK